MLMLKRAFVCEQQLAGLNICEGLFSRLLANSMSKYLRDSFFRSNAHASFIRKRKTIQDLGLPGLQQKTQACNEKKVQRQAHTVTGLDIGRTRWHNRTHTVRPFNTVKHTENDRTLSCGASVRSTGWRPTEGRRRTARHRTPPSVRSSTPDASDGSRCSLFSFWRRPDATEASGEPHRCVRSGKFEAH